MARAFHAAAAPRLDRDVAIEDTIREQSGGTWSGARSSRGAVTGHLEHPAVVPVHALGDRR